MGITRDHPSLQQMASRPWRDGRDVLNAAIRHLPEVFVVTPSGSLFAPDFVELQMNPGDIASLCQQMELDVASTSVTEVYEDQVAKHRARFVGSGRPEVYITGDDSVPQGRYRVRRGLPESARYSAGPWDLPDGPDFNDRRSPFAGATALDAVGAGFAAERVAAASRPGYAQPVGGGGSARTRYEVLPGRTIMDGMPTVMEQIRPGGSCAAAGDGLIGGRDLDVRRAGRARAGGAGAARCADGVQGARAVHVRRRPLVGHQPGHERAFRQRCPGLGQAAGE